MRTKTKALVLALCAVLLVVSTVFVTMAYLTSQDSVTNTFTVGQVNITLDEADVKPDGKYESDKKTRVKANEYKLIPGHTYIKDPTIYVSEGSEDCYLFVTIKNDIANIEDSANTIAAQMKNNGWKPVEGENGVYCYCDGDGNKKVVEEKENKILFSEFTISGSVENKALTGYSTSADKTQNIIEIKAYAIQADGFESKTIAEIWAAAKPTE